MSGWIVLVASVLALTGCIEPSLRQCPNNVACPVGTVCDGHGGCAVPDQLTSCANGIDGDACSYENLAGQRVDGVCSDKLCVPIGCGNRLVSPDEVCDDGNTVNGDGCSADCRSNETCGNNIIDPAADEQCDDGNLEDGDSCQHDCKTPRCGDGIVDVALAETCDLGTGNSATAPDTCRTNCQLPRCGDGVVDSGEVCDDGDNQSGDGCSGDCLSDETCGNSILDFATGEQCDAGSANGDVPDGCRGDCKLPLCGDGVIDPGRGEQCDDGVNNGDVSDLCRSNCLVPRCGDTIVDVMAGEVCDDGNLVSGDGCRPDCLSNESCGNNLLDPAVGEQCDDGNAIGRDGCSGCRVEDMTVKIPGQTPSARSGHGLAYDAARQRVVLFGGTATSGSLNGETWEWDGFSWTQIHPRTTPTPRANMAMTYDGTRHRVVMFGGTSGASVLNDTWEWDGRDWSLRQPATKPNSRVGAAATWDPIGGRVLLVGGANDGMWSWDGTTWTRIEVATTALNNRSFSALTYDPIRQNVVVIGGTNSNTWTWNGTSFDDHGVAPFGAKRATAAFDARRGRVVAWINDTASTATFEWDGVAWTSVNGAPLQARSGSALVFDARRDQLLLFGGTVSGTPLSDTWLRTDTSWQAPPPWSTYVPEARSRAAATYDPLHRRVLVAGGTAALPTAGTYTVDLRGDYAAWDGTHWEVDGIPGEHLGSPGLTVDRTGNVYYCGANDVALGVVWQIDGSALTLLSSDVDWHPPGAMTAYDLLGNQLVAVGETSGYFWNAQGWSSQSFPFGGHNGGMTYDPVRERIVQYGGYSSSSGIVWERGPAGWAQVTPSPGTAVPEMRKAAPLVYSPDVRTVVMFGNSVTPDEQFWTWNGIRWNQRAVDGQVPSLYGAAFTYDAARHQFVRFGGRTPTAPINDTVLLEYHSYTPVEACTEAELDYDNDGLAGCADPECWAVCMPLCTPGTECDTSGPRCGDSSCDAFEDCRICPTDCGQCVGRCGDLHCDQGEEVSCVADCS